MKVSKTALAGSLVVALTLAMSTPAVATATDPLAELPPATEVGTETLADAVSELLAETADTLPVEIGEVSDQGVVIGDDDSAELLIQGAGGDHALVVGLPVKDGVEPRVTEHGDAIYESSNEGAEVLVQELDVTDEPLLQAAARTVFTLESYDVDPLFTLEFDVPGATEMLENEDGSVTVFDENRDILLYVGSPWAIDAAGEMVSTWYEFEDGNLYQYVDHLSREHEYPIVADPAFLVPVLLVGGRIIIQRVVASSASAATRTAVSAVAQTGANVVGRAALKSFIKSNYRHNLIVWTNKNPGTRCEAHHTLPQNFRKKFENSGFTGNDSIDHPRYLVWWEKSDHRSKAPAVNRSWSDWWGTRSKASRASILDKRTAVLRQYPPRC